MIYFMPNAGTPEMQSAEDELALARAQLIWAKHCKASAELWAQRAQQYPEHTYSLASAAYWRVEFAKALAAILVCPADEITAALKGGAA